MKINEVFVYLLDFIYKKRCFICKSAKENKILCSKCKKEIVYNKPHLLKYIDNIAVYSCCEYSGIAKNLIKLLKFHNKKPLAKEIAKISFNYLYQLNIDFSDYEIVCVPLHINKKRKRGFNQCELISTELANILNIPYNFELIKKIKNTKPMYKLKNYERYNNLKNAFFVDKTKYNNKKIILFDDITTTGSTLKEIIKELKQNNINDITCFTFTNT